jgi:hypothetical protein
MTETRAKYATANQSPDDARLAERLAAIYQELDQERMRLSSDPAHVDVADAIREAQGALRWAQERLSVE